MLCVCSPTVSSYLRLNCAVQVLVSCLLHGHAGVYEPAAVAAWEALESKYGDTVELSV